MIVSTLRLFDPLSGFKTLALLLCTNANHIMIVTPPPPYRPDLNLILVLVNTLTLHFPLSITTAMGVDLLLRWAMNPVLSYWLTFWAACIWHNPASIREFTVPQMPYSQPHTHCVFSQICFHKCGLLPTTSLTPTVPIRQT